MGGSYGFLDFRLIPEPCCDNARKFTSAMDNVNTLNVSGYVYGLGH
jgi:hypothetical protein